MDALLSLQRNLKGSSTQLSFEREPMHKLGEILLPFLK